MLNELPPTSNKIERVNKIRLSYYRLKVTENNRIAVAHDNFEQAVVILKYDCSLLFLMPS